jgi:hypothetical protein
MNTATIDPEEGLLAEIGVSTLIRGDMPKVSMALALRASNIMRDVDEAVGKMVRGAGNFASIPKGHSYRDLLERFSQPFPAAETQEIIDAFPAREHALSGPFSLLVQHVFAELRGIFPISKVNGFAGPKNIQPTDDRVWHFFNTLAVLDKPLRVIPLMGCAGLLKSQVAAMRSVYPTLSQYIDHAVIEAVIAAKADNEDYQLPPRAEIGVTTWKGGKVLPFTAPKTPEPKPTGTKSATIDKSDLTVGQQGSST